MSEVFIGFIFVAFSGFLQGTYASFLKYMKPWKWENFWSIYSIVALVLSPILLSWFLIPHFSEVLTSVPTNQLYLPLLFGALWGIGGVLFGLSVINIGLSLTYTIILGLTTLLGSILPIFINKIVPGGNQLVFLGFGLGFMLLGIILSGHAGKLKERGVQVKKGKLSGIFLAVLSGIFSPMLNVGFVKGAEISKVAQDFGSSPQNSSFLIWMVVLFSGFLVNIFYTIYLFLKNKSFGLFRAINLKVFFAAVLAGLFWFGSVAVFGLASVKMGKLGPAVGWGSFITLSIVVSNFWGIRAGEWKGYKKALSYQIKAITLMIFGVVLIAASVLA